MSQKSRENTLAQAKAMGLELNADGTAWIPIDKSGVSSKSVLERRQLNGKEVVMIVILSFSALLAIIAIFGSSWISIEIRGSHIAEFGLNDAHGPSGSENYGESCQISQDGDTCASARAGLIGTIGLSIGIFLNLVCCLNIWVSTKGFEFLSILPQFGKTIVQWGAGISMMLGIGIWLATWGFYFTSSIDPHGHFGIHFWMAVCAALLALMAPIFNRFVVSKEVLNHQIE